MEILKPFIEMNKSIKIGVRIFYQNVEPWSKFTTVRYLSVLTEAVRLVHGK